MYEVRRAILIIVAFLILRIAIPNEPNTNIRTNAVSRK